MDKEEGKYDNEARPLPCMSACCFTSEMKRYEINIEKQCKNCVHLPVCIGWGRQKYPCKNVLYERKRG